MTALQFLQASRAHIDKPNKWTKHTLLSPMGSVCSLGALQKTFVEANGRRPMGGPKPENEWLQGDMLAAGRYLAEALGVADIMEPAQFMSYIANYNDAEMIHYADVIAMFDRAIVLARADEEVERISVADLIEELSPA